MQVRRMDAQVERALQAGQQVQQRGRICPARIADNHCTAFGGQQLAFAEGRPHALQNLHGQ